MNDVLAFDVFNTIVMFADVPYKERKSYSDQLKADEYKDLVLPDWWDSLPAYPDSKEGIARLRTKYDVITFTNCPLAMRLRLFENIGIEVDLHFPLEFHQVHKPKPRAYSVLAQHYEGRKVTVISANKKFGDIEGARAAGMESLLIRNGYPNTIVELAEMLGC